MSSGSVIVIGGGVAGLCSGIYAAANGYETTIFEMHTLPGGLCTSWDRQGYTFDGCIHWFVGGKPGSGFRRMWDEVGATDGLSLIPHDRLSTIRDSEGHDLTLWADLDRLRREGLATWPGESRGFDEVVKGARAMAAAGTSAPDTPPDMMGALDGLKMLVKSAPSLAKMRKYMNMSMSDVAAQFDDPVLRRMILHAINEPRMGAMAFLGTLGWFETGDANWVEGGSLGFARKLERRFLALGGAISYGSKVDRILVENDRAVGVRLGDGSEHRSDHVIGAADGHATIFEMLEGRYADERVREIYDKLEPFSSLIQVSLGVDMDLSQEPWSYVLLLEEGARIGGQATTSIWTHHYCYDASMAPRGKSSVTAILGADLEPWKQLRDTDRASIPGEEERGRRGGHRGDRARVPRYRTARRGPRCGDTSYLCPLHGQLEGFVRGLAALAGEHQDRRHGGPSSEAPRSLQLRHGRPVGLARWRAAVGVDDGTLGGADDLRRRQPSVRRSRLAGPTDLLEAPVGDLGFVSGTSATGGAAGPDAHVAAVPDLPDVEPP